VTLDSAAAGALNSVFNVTAFKGGFGIGTAQVIIDLPNCFDLSDIFELLF
jgi:fructose-1-phosphate kinase PfkB-like protein